MTKDLEIMQTIQEYNTLTQLDLSVVAQNVSRTITGTQGLVQKIILMLLTPYDEVRGVGTGFATALYQGQIGARRHIPPVFAVAAYKIQQAINAEAESDEERIASLTLESYGVRAQRIYISIKLTTEASDDYVFEFPVE